MFIMGETKIVTNLMSHSVDIESTSLGRQPEVSLGPETIKVSETTEVTSTHKQMGHICRVQQVLGGFRGYESIQHRISVVNFSKIDLLCAVSLHPNINLAVDITLIGFGNHL